ncbi:hypothetical protein Ais01nite_50340 [Asanoa ishikariensis]|uniref:Uncharacterized protein n=1 Tax=Asanoa ishikariensis TaxID=137265 RepID=A0A1H3RR82_9ACTN|nr:hypothetical protein [Asanoa ishikariensis]GIF66999.1 hypothetical protein Ais01nite_50340 [Asanoa ishikariensis]SDZ27399.1 hypothetical protein SAMN05421684_4047 [Asanoa ishikariensis]
MADLEELAGRLDHELPDVAWDEPDRIRSRGRTRAQRRSTVLAAVAVLVVLAGAGWLVTGTRSTPAAPPEPVPATTSAAPTQPAVIDGSTLFPKTAMLQPADVGAGYQVTDDVGYSPGSYPTWAFGGDDCPAYAGLDITAFKSYLWFRHANLEGDGPPVFTEGSRFPAGLGARVMADIDRVTTACAKWDRQGGEATSEQRPGVTTTTYTVLARDFAGDQARLVRKQVRTVGEDGAELFEGTVMIAAVRVGDRVSFVLMEQDEPERVRLLGERAADRLCAADNAC